MLTAPARTLVTDFESALSSELARPLFVYAEAAGEVAA
jgi:hypothetical protein